MKPNKRLMLSSHRLWLTAGTSCVFIAVRVSVCVLAYVDCMCQRGSQKSPLRLTQHHVSLLASMFVCDPLSVAPQCPAQADAGRRQHAFLIELPHHVWVPEKGSHACACPQCILKGLPVNKWTSCMFLVVCFKFSFRLIWSLQMKFSQVTAALHCLTYF